MIARSSSCSSNLKRVNEWILPFSAYSNEPDAAVTIDLSSMFDEMLSSDLALESSRELADLKETTELVSVRLSAAEIRRIVCLLPV